MALGSLIIAIVQFIRAVIHYFDQQTKGAQKRNFFLRYVVRLLIESVMLGVYSDASSVVSHA